LVIPHPSSFQQSARSSLIPQEIDPRSISLLLGGEQGPQDQNPSAANPDWSAVTGHRIILGRGGKAVRYERQGREDIDRLLKVGSGKGGLSPVYRTATRVPAENFFGMVSALQKKTQVKLRVTAPEL
jgi:hypothetical protein